MQIQIKSKKRKKKTTKTQEPIIEPVLIPIFLPQQTTKKQTKKKKTTKEAIPERLPEREEELKDFYKKYGAKATILAYMLIKGKPLHLYDIFRFHQEIAGVASDNSTRKALNRLIKDGLVKKIDRGIYVAIPEAKELFRGAIDWKRVRTKFSLGSGKGKISKPSKKKVKNIEKQIERVLRIAKSLAEKGDYMRATSLLAHTLLGIRQTGVLLYREGDLFVYYENKDKSIRAIHSKELAEIFDELGIPEGALYDHINYRAGKIIHNVFGGYKKARKMHYYLKRELKWFYGTEKGGIYWYLAEERKLILEIDGTEIVIAVDMEELIKTLLQRTNPLPEEQIKKEANHFKKDIKGVIRTYEHTKKENELFYHNYATAL